jgi:hypothetical protein
MRRILLATLTILLLAGVVTTAHAATPAETQAEADFLSRTNADRAANGVSGLRVASDLVDIARRHAADMAASNSIYHSSNLGGTIQNWQKIGENVGRGTNVDVVQNAFMASPAHRENILDSAFTETGIGVVWKDSTLYVTVLFRKPASSAAAAPAPAPSKPAPAPAPVHTASVAAQPRPAAAAVTPAPPAPPAPPAIPAFSPEAVAAAMAGGHWDPATLTTQLATASHAAPSHHTSDVDLRAWAVLARILAVMLVGALGAVIYQRRLQMTFRPA